MFGSQPAWVPHAGAGRSTTACTVCGSTHAELDEGVYVCSECGARSHELFAEEAEFQVGVNVTTRDAAKGLLRRRRAPRDAKPPKKKRPGAHLAEQPRAAAAAYAEGLQRVLRAQVAASACLLPPGEGVPHQLAPLVCSVWDAYVAASHVLCLNIDQPTSVTGRQKAAARAEKERLKAATLALGAPPASGGGGDTDGDSEGDTSSSSDEGEEEEEAGEGEAEEAEGGAGGDGGGAPPRKRARVPHVSVPLVRLAKALHAHLPPATTLGVLWLCCHLLRLPVGASHVAHAAASGALPYIGAHAGLPPRLLASCPPGALCCDSTPTQRAIGTAACAIAAALALPMPPACGGPLVARLVAEIGAPIEAGIVAGALLDLHPSPDLAPPRDTPLAGRPPPEAHCGAALLVALQLLYGLGSEEAATPRSKCASATAAAPPAAAAARGASDPHASGAGGDGAAVAEDASGATPPPAPPTDPALPAPPAPPVDWFAWAASASRCRAPPAALLPGVVRPGARDGARLPPPQLDTLLAFARTSLFPAPPAGLPRALADAHRVLGAIAASLPQPPAPPAATAPQPQPRWAVHQPRPYTLTHNALGHARLAPMQHAAVASAVAGHLGVPLPALMTALDDLERRMFAAEAAAQLEEGRSETQI